jgi:hypothetical protein
MTRFWETKQFSELSREWAKKLAESEFKDIEVEINGERKLQQYTITAYRTAGMQDRMYVESRVRYFDLVLECINRDVRLSQVERFIMTLYAEGQQQCEILKQLQRMGHKCHRITISRMVCRCLTKWGLPLPPRAKQK